MLRVCGLLSPYLSLDRRRTSSCSSSTAGAIETALSYSSSASPPYHTYRYAPVSTVSAANTPYLSTPSATAATASAAAEGAPGIQYGLNDPGHERFVGSLDALATRKSWIRISAGFASATGLSKTT